MAQYDPQILQTYANKLYSRAHGIIAAMTLIGLIVGAVGGIFVAAGLQIGNMGVVVAVVAVVGGVVGFALGSDRAFHLKFQAQLALCQRQIELNTRTTSAAEPPEAR
jgi:predicted signal transduction protein with EAL and GGDEF domain